MGSKQSSTNYGTLKFLTMKETYTSGDTVHGILQINLHQGYPSNKLVIQLIGLEKTGWSKWVGKSKVPFQGNQIIYSHELEIPLNVEEARFREKVWLPVGVYEYPFKFKLASGLPSSVERVKVSMYEDFYAEVKYKLIASIKAIEGGIQKIKVEKCLNVVESYQIRGRKELRANFQGVQLHQHFFELKYLDFPVRKNSRKRDTKTSISCELQKGNYCQEENIMGKVEIDNSSSPQIVKAIECKLKCKIIVKDNHDKIKQIVFTLNSCYSDQVIDKGCSDTVSFNLKCENEKENKKLPPTCNQGKIIKIEYFILINVKYQNQNINDARLQIPITLQQKSVSLQSVEDVSNEQDRMEESAKPHSAFDIVEIKLDKTSKFKLSNRKISKF
eukprot:TRINITY_DN5440_c0_g1_i2.p1 TRINITY_DN5440_c0_g1~~TRINITY_DN5440_c0_g1_i2.p1  ORF type:complete len:387 (-),score=42.38 TRINITY_DN5440_c0_g1_i2:245-1405(-)